MVRMHLALLQLNILGTDKRDPAHEVPEGDAPSGVKSVEQPL